MLMITEQHNAETLIFRLAGRLTGAWATELERLWRNAITGETPRRLLVDLSQVIFVDETGKAVLTLMTQAGAELIAVDVLMKSIVEEIAAKD
jgi:anti-anti-sigma regulatory factor